MAEQETTSTYHVPASQEAVVIRTPEISLSDLSEAELAYQQAMESAVSTHELDPTDVDHRRIESRLGSSTIAAAELTVSQPEIAFDPTDTNHLVACGVHIVRMRTIETGGIGLAA